MCWWWQDWKGTFRHYCKANVLVAWNCWDFALLWRLRNGTEEDPVILSELEWSQSSLMKSGCCLAGLQWIDWLSKPSNCTLSFPSAGVLNPSPSHTKSPLLAAHDKGRGEPLLIVRRWCWGKCFLLCAYSHHLFLFCLLSICFFYSLLVSVQSPSFPLFLPCSEKRKQWIFSLSGLWIHSHIFQLNIPLNKAVSGRGYWQ